MTMWFSQPVVEFGGAFTYIEPVTIAAYGVGDLLLDTTISTWSVNTGLGGVPGSAPNEQLRVAAPGIVRVLIAGNDLGASFTADNLFATEVPEPGTGLLLCGALLCCFWSRKIFGKIVPLIILCLPGSSVAATIGPANVNPRSLTAGVPAEVVITCTIADAAFVDGSANLIRVDPTGRTLAVLGVLRDDGLQGDATAGDRIYTLRMTFTEPAPAQVRLRISAAFRGLLQRVQSDTLLVDVVAQGGGDDELVVQPRVTSGIQSTWATVQGKGVITGVPASAPPRERALAFLAANAPAFGLSSAADVAVKQEIPRDEVGLEQVRFQQLHRGVPVTGGEMLVHLRGDRVVSANSEFLLKPSVPTTPAISADDAVRRARELIGRLKTRAWEEAVYSAPKL